MLWGVYLDDGDVGEVDRDVEGGEEREALGHGQSGSHGEKKEKKGEE